MKRVCEKCQTVYVVTQHKQRICLDCRTRCRECGKTLNKNTKGSTCVECLRLDDTGHEKAALKRLAARQARELKPTAPPAFRCQSLAATVECPTPAHNQNRGECLTGKAAARCHATGGGTGI